MSIPVSVFHAGVSVRYHSVGAPVTHLAAQNGYRARGQERRAGDLLTSGIEALAPDAQRVEGQTWTLVYKQKEAVS